MGGFVETVATLATKKGEVLTLALDSTAGWDTDHLTGTFTTADGMSRSVVARRNAFGRTWYLTADGDADNGWTLSYSEDSKTANKTVTLSADGSTKIAGKIGTLNISASGYSGVTGVSSGVIFADFAPIVSLKEEKTTIKRVLSIRTNLWFDRSNGHAEGVGTARIAE